jgi:Tfp pilus assembly protein PilF
MRLPLRTTQSSRTRNVSSHPGVLMPDSRRLERSTTGSSSFATRSSRRAIAESSGSEPFLARADSDPWHRKLHAALRGNGDRSGPQREGLARVHSRGRCRGQEHGDDVHVSRTRYQGCCSRRRGDFRAAPGTRDRPDSGLRWVDAERIADDAEHSARRAIELDPKDARAAYDLGVILGEASKSDEALELYRVAIELRLDFPKPWCNAGLILLRRGQYSESLPFLVKGHEPGSRLPGWPYPSESWLNSAQRNVELERRLDELSAGSLAPRSFVEAAEYAMCAYGTRRFVAAVSIFRAALVREDGASLPRIRPSSLISRRLLVRLPSES